MGFWITAYHGATCALGTYSHAEAVQGPGNHREGVCVIPLTSDQWFPSGGTIPTPPNQGAYCHQHQHSAHPEASVPLSASLAGAIMLWCK